MLTGGRVLAAIVKKPRISLSCCRCCCCCSCRCRCCCSCRCLFLHTTTNARVPHPSRTCDGWDVKPHPTVFVFAVACSSIQPQTLGCPPIAHFRWWDVQPHLRSLSFLLPYARFACIYAPMFTAQTIFHAFTQQNRMSSPQTSPKAQLPKLHQQDKSLGKVVFSYTQSSIIELEIKESPGSRRGIFISKGNQRP